MKLSFLFLYLIAIIPFSLKAQSIEAKYSVSQEIAYTDPYGKVQTLIFEYTGMLYKKGSRYISFKKPLYLDKYPSGTIDFVYSANHSGSVGVFMDTIQSLNYIDFDSLLWRYRSDMSGKGNVTFNYMRNFEPEAKQWEILPETKEINGLACQKAILKSLDGRIVHEVWFSPDVSMLAGPVDIFGLPGLVVEAHSFLSRQTWILESYVSEIDISDSTFWPNEFLQSFKELSPLKKRTTIEGPSKKEKQMEIINQ